MESFVLTIASLKMEKWGFLQQSTSWQNIYKLSLEMMDLFGY